MTSIWLTIVTVGMLTYLTRLSFIMILSHWQTPLIIQRALRFVPVAVLAAIILPELIFQNDTIIISMENPRLLAGIIAILVAWKTKNIAWTVLVGMGILLLVQSFI